ncbi:hypothetical protein RXV95_10225 [Novosphingobium sp. ZN18A2]|uniref:hypothetical protein n=1 Tax=Novosphingobium sp. ZN18A2 TaxID=3079861 RepID=UPI0030CF77AB
MNRHTQPNRTTLALPVFAFALAMVAMAPGASNAAAPAMACGGAAVLAGLARRFRRHSDRRFTWQSLALVALLTGGAFASLALRTPDGPAPAVWLVGAAVFAATFAIALKTGEPCDGRGIA